MKKIYYIIIILLSGTQILAQYSYYKYPVKSDSLACLQDLSIYREFERQGLHDEAVKSWVKAYNSCKGTKKLVYQDGVKFLKKAIDAEKDKVKRNILIDSMMNIYSERIKYFGQAAFVKGRQGIDLLNSDRNRVKEAYELLQLSLSELKEKSDPAVVAHYMLATYLLYYKKNSLSSRDAIENYLMSIDVLEKQIQQAKETHKDFSNSKKALKFTDNIFIKTKVANCNNISYLIDKEIDINNTDLSYLKKMQHLLQVSNCVDHDFYMQILIKLQSINPSFENAHLLSNLFVKKGEYVTAISYFENAASLSNKSKIKAQCYKEIAKLRCFRLHEFKQAKSDILKSLSYQSNSGEAYMLWGDIYALASSNFAEDNFSKATVLWVAIDKYNKAKLLDKSLSAKVNQKIAYYKNYLPSQEEAFMRGYKNGDKYHIKSWINEETTIKLLVK